MKYFPFALDVGGLGFEYCVFIAGWRHLRRGVCMGSGEDDVGVTAGSWTEVSWAHMDRG